MKFDNFLEYLTESPDSFDINGKSGAFKDADAITFSGTSDFLVFGRMTHFQLYMALLYRQYGLDHLKKKASILGLEAGKTKFMNSSVYIPYADLKKWNKQITIIGLKPKIALRRINTGREVFQITGRIWTEKKVVSMWEIDTSKSMERYLGSMFRKLGVNPKELDFEIALDPDEFTVMNYERFSGLFKTRKTYDATKLKSMGHTMGGVWGKALRNI